jgi:hypothetical protein
MGPYGQREAIRKGRLFVFFREDGDPIVYVTAFGAP